MSRMNKLHIDSIKDLIDDALLFSATNKASARHRLIQARDKIDLLLKSYL